MVNLPIQLMHLVKLQVELAYQPIPSVYKYGAIIKADFHMDRCNLITKQFSLFSGFLTLR